MIDKFLKAKHWQLFILLFGVPMLFQFAFMGTMVANAVKNPNPPHPLDVFNEIKYFPIIIVVYSSVLFGWLWSVVIGLQAKIPEDAKMKLARFKVFFFIPLIYIIAITLFVSSVVSGLVNLSNDPNPEVIIAFVVIILPLHLFSIFCMFHTFFFVAKTIKTVELQQEVRFSEFAGEFILTWLYFIGVWILQPKINKMAVNNIEENSPDKLI